MVASRAFSPSRQNASRGKELHASEVFFCGLEKFDPNVPHRAKDDFRDVVVPRATVTFARVADRLTPVVKERYLHTARDSACSTVTVEDLYREHVAQSLMRKRPSYTSWFQEEAQHLSRTAFLDIFGELHGIPLIHLMLGTG